MPLNKLQKVLLDFDKPATSEPFYLQTILKNTSPCNAMFFPCICKEWRLQSEHQMVVLSYLLGPFNLFRLASSKMQIAASRLENLCNPGSLAASGHRCLSDKGERLRHSQPELNHPAVDAVLLENFIYCVQ